MASHQDPSSFLSLHQLLEELENFIYFESSRNGNFWISVDKLSELFYQKYGVSLEEVVKAQGYSDSLRSLFTRSRRFLIYGTQIPQNFYVALFKAGVPGFYQSQISSVEYKIKKSWKVDGNLPRKLNSESDEEIPSRQIQRILDYQPILVPEIKSVNELEIALMEIIKSLTKNDPKQFVTIAVLSKKFHDYYKQPIRTVMRSVCPDIKLIDLLQSMPNLYVKEVDKDWQITVAPYSPK